MSFGNPKITQNEVSNRNCIIQIKNRLIDGNATIGCNGADRRVLIGKNWVIIFSAIRFDFCVLVAFVSFN